MGDMIAVATQANGPLWHFAGNLDVIDGQTSRDLVRNDITAYFVALGKLCNIVRATSCPSPRRAIGV